MILSSSASDRYIYFFFSFSRKKGFLYEVTFEKKNVYDIDVSGCYFVVKPFTTTGIALVTKKSNFSKYRLEANKRNLRN